jgi:hypothetical protein
MEALPNIYFIMEKRLRLRESLECGTGEGICGAAIKEGWIKEVCHGNFSTAANAS